MCSIAIRQYHQFSSKDIWIIIFLHTVLIWLITLLGVAIEMLWKRVMELTALEHHCTMGPIIIGCIRSGSRTVETNLNQEIAPHILEIISSSFLILMILFCRVFDTLKYEKSSQEVVRSLVSNITNMHLKNLKLQFFFKIISYIVLVIENSSFK